MRKLTRLGIFTSLMMVLFLSQINFSSAYALSGSYQNLDGTNINYSSYEGQFVFLEAFSTTCGYCIEQHPIIGALYDAYGTEIVFITVAIYHTIDSIQTVTAFKADYPTEWHLGLDDGNLKDTFSIGGTPNMFLLDKAGNILERFNGFTDKNTLAYAFEIHVRENTDATQPTNTDNVFTGNPNDESLISNIVGNPVFQMASIIVIVAIIYFKTTGGKPV